jgi:hypothetical protein
VHVTGPEHYREALLELEAAASCEYGCPHLGCPHSVAHLAFAQVNATLALAAATALNDHDGGTPMPEWHHWRAAAGYAAKADTDFVSNYEAQK